MSLQKMIFLFFGCLNIVKSNTFAWEVKWQDIKSCFCEKSAKKSVSVVRKRFKLVSAMELKNRKR